MKKPMNYKFVRTVYYVAFAAVFFALIGTVGVLNKQPRIKFLTKTVRIPERIIEREIIKEPKEPKEEPLGATIPVSVAIFETSLQASITSGATSMTLNSGTDKSGDNLSGYICFTIDEGTTSEEFVCGTASGTSITGMVRGLDPVDGDTEVTSLQKAHRRGASVKITNYPQLGIVSRVLNGDETLPNTLTYAATTTPSAQGDLVHKYYVDNVALSGAANASTSTAGIVEIATISQLAAGTEIGDDSGAVMCANVADFGNTSSAKQMVPVTDADGDLPGEFIETDFAYTWSGNNTYSGTAAFSSAVNASSTLDVDATNFRLGGVNYTGTMGDLNEAEAFFDGTDISDTEAQELTQNTSSTTLHFHPTATGSYERTQADGTGTDVIAHGLGITPKLIKITAYERNAASDYSASTGSATTASDESCVSMGGSSSWRQATGYIICLTNDAGTLTGTAQLTGLDSSNITLNWDDRCESTAGCGVLWEAYW